MFKRLLSVCTALLLMATIACATYLISTYIFTPGEKPLVAVLQAITGEGKLPEQILIRQGTIIREETEYLCGCIMVDFQGLAPEYLRGASESKARQFYSPEEGWKITKQADGIIAFNKTVGELCDQHKQYRHIGIDDDKLAVYKGPLGYDQELIRVEVNMPVDQLPPQLYTKLLQANDFDKQDFATKLQLREKLEFTSEQHLNTVLDSLDEVVESQ